MNKRLTLLLLALALVPALPANAQKPETIDFGKGTLRLTPLTERTVRVVYEEQPAPDSPLPELLYVGKVPNPDLAFRRKDKASSTSLKLHDIRIDIDREHLTLAAFDRKGRRVALIDGHTLTPVHTAGMDQADAGRPQDHHRLSWIRCLIHAL